MYGQRDIYNAPRDFILAGRSGGKIRSSYGGWGNADPDAIGDAVASEMVDEIYGGVFDDIGKWAKGLVDPGQRLENMKERLPKLVEKWEMYHERGDTQADKIAARIGKLVQRIKQREPSWEIPEDVQEAISSPVGATPAPSSVPTPSTSATVSQAVQQAATRVRPSTDAGLEDLAKAWALARQGADSARTEAAKQQLVSALKERIATDPAYEPTGTVETFVEAYGQARPRQVVVDTGSGMLVTNGQPTHIRSRYGAIARGQHIERIADRVVTDMFSR